MREKQYERLRRQLDVMRAMCQDGTLLTSECEAAPVTKASKDVRISERREPPQENAQMIEY